MEPPTPVNVRVKHLRARGLTSFAEWDRLPNTVYVGRKVRYVEGTYDSDWGNYRRLEPAKYAETLEASRPDLIERLGELAGNEIGCWCVPDKPCHAEALAGLFRKHTILTS